MRLCSPECRGKSRSREKDRSVQIAPCLHRHQAGQRTVLRLVAADSEGATIVWAGGTIPDTPRHLPRVDYMLGNRGGAQIQAYKLKP